MRTPHGDADVSIVSAPAGTTLGDVVAAVTGQALPRLVQVDDHVVDATTLLDDPGLFEGSVVTSEPMVAAVASDADVDLVQIAGHGAGQISRLEPGRYRIGPGRRSSADELTLAPVEHTMFELVVEPTAAASEVTVVAEQPDTAVDSATDVLIDGIRVDHPTRWSTETLSVGRRAFQIDTPVRSIRRGPCRPRIVMASSNSADHHADHRERHGVPSSTRYATPPARHPRCGNAGPASLMRSRYRSAFETTVAPRWSPSI